MNQKILDTIDSAHISLRPQLLYRGNLVMGVMLISPEGVGGIGLSYECDNMAETLLHETIHYINPFLDEDLVDIHTEKLWNDPYIRRKSQSKIVELCGKYDI